MTRKLIIVRDLNYYVGKAYDEFKGVNGSFGYREKNEESGVILDFVAS